MKVDRNLSVLLVGAYGVVGRQVAAILRRDAPNLPLILAGRHLEKATALAEEVGNATAISLDITAPVLPTEITPALIVALVNDPDDHLLNFAINNRIPYLDITRWTARLQSTLVNVLASPEIESLVVFASSWMASLPATLAKGMASNFQAVDQIELNILYAIKDKAGPNSAEYMDRLHVPFEVIEAGKRQTYFPMSTGKSIQFADGKTHRVFRFDTPDQAILPSLTGAAGVSSRIGFDDKISNYLLCFLAKSGVWRLISGKLFKAVRRAILYNPGAGDAHQIRITITGQDESGNELVQSLLVLDPKGQTHLTALGVAILIERILETQAQPQPLTGITFGEALLNPQLVTQRLLAEGIILKNG